MHAAARKKTGAKLWSKIRAKRSGSLRNWLTSADHSGTAARRTVVLGARRSFAAGSSRWIPRPGRSCRMLAAESSCPRSAATHAAAARRPRNSTGSRSARGASRTSPWRTASSTALPIGVVEMPAGYLSAHSSSSASSPRPSQTPRRPHTSSTGGDGFKARRTKTAPCQQDSMANSSTALTAKAWACDPVVAMAAAALASCLDVGRCWQLHARFRSQSTSSGWKLLPVAARQIVDAAKNWTSAIADSSS
mmetsp:Transcript_6042/g.11552  ORF Transcript_6042/g.11552 Transcript_6042/m.11552 type:complete len:249 (-) Transcript_6042:223-969(-)